MNLREYIRDGLNIYIKDIDELSEYVFACEKYALYNELYSSEQFYQKLYEYNKNISDYSSYGQKIEHDNNPYLSFDEASKSQIFVNLNGNNIHIYTCNYDTKSIKNFISQIEEQESIIAKTNITYLSRTNFNNEILSIYAKYDDVKNLPTFDNQYCAKKVVTKHQAIIIIFILLFLGISAYYAPGAIFLSVILITNFIYGIEQILKIFMLICGLGHRVFNKESMPPIGTAEHIYSVLIPMYKESNIIKQMIGNIENLNYPKHLLDVKIILEEDDEDTIKIAYAEKPDWVDVVVVPISYPKTKPKALNIALRFAMGKYVTVYDAEDNFDKDQLLQAINNFSDKIICVQSVLEISNADHNILSYWFYLEYRIWFWYLRKGIDIMKLPMPLGGTSNHFIKDKLIEVGAWDAYNVTEDAELGVRISKNGYDTVMIDSLTYEDSVKDVASWIKQRSRWIKGFFQTYLVHMRKLRGMPKKMGIMKFIVFQVLIGFQPLSAIFTPVIYFCFIFYGYNIGQIPDYMVKICNHNATIGILLNMVSAAIVVMMDKKHKSGLTKKDILYIILYPAYFMLHFIAALRGLWQLISAPHFWDKTKH